jgi:hypothetical protein
LEVGGHRRALSVGEEYAKRLLALAGTVGAESIVERLVWKYPSHDFGIDFEEAQDLKLPVGLLDRSQDERLTAAILELEEDGITFNGFISDQAQSLGNTKVQRTKGRGPRPSPAATVNGPAPSPH